MLLIIITCWCTNIFIFLHESKFNKVWATCWQKKSQCQNQTNKFTQVRATWVEDRVQQREMKWNGKKVKKVKLQFKPCCHTRFQRAFTTCVCVFKVITLVRVVVNMGVRREAKRRPLTPPPLPDKPKLICTCNEALLIKIVVFFLEGGGFLAK